MLRKCKEMPAKILYSTSAKAIGGRDGRATTTDNHLDVQLTVPKELGGPGGEGTNPEQLFAAGYAACFLSALKHIGANERLRIPPETSVTAKVGIGPNEGDGFGLDVELEVSIPGIDREKAEELVSKAHQVCPYSNATRNNLDVRLNVV